MTMNSTKKIAFKILLSPWLHSDGSSKVNSGPLHAPKPFPPTADGVFLAKWVTVLLSKFSTERTLGKNKFTYFNWNTNWAGKKENIYFHETILCSCWETSQNLLMGGCFWIGVHILRNSASDVTTEKYKHLALVVKHWIRTSVQMRTQEIVLNTPAQVHLLGARP